jgi:hypothetical protein
MPQLQFQYVPSEEHFLVVAPSGRTYRLRPNVYEQALRQGERLFAGGAHELILEAPGEMRLRIGGCARTTYERTLQLMRETWQYHQHKTLQQYGDVVTAAGEPIDVVGVGDARSRRQ